ncbi:hypothetical protein FQR65_LT13473 [Abscondita terminalis]|nr:hypothetical protein FQR65_LT13473 [Abscondita terminalis]
MFKNFVLFLIISATSARVHLTKNKEADLKKCVAQSVENIFDRDQTLTFVSDVGGGFVFPDAIENPYVMTNSSLAKVPKFAEIVSNDLNQVMHYTPTMSLDFDSEFVPKRIKLLLITTIANNVTEVFKKFWINGYENVVMIAYGTNYEPTIFYSDPYATVNKCRQEVKDLVVGDCASKTKYRFKDDRLRKYPNCNLLADITFFVFRDLLNGASIACSILSITTKYLNMSLEFSSENSSSVSTFDITQSNIQTYDALSWTTVPYFRDDVIWIVPSPNQIAPMFVLKMVFKPTLWVVVFITFVCTAIVWWLLEKIYIKSSLSSAFLKVYSITISGSINDIPFQRSLRTIFIIYVVYSIHIQTAFTSNLIQLLTVPQYEPHITNLEDLADSNLPVITVYDIYKFIHLEQDDNKLYSTIYKRLMGVSVDEVVKLLIGDFNNYTIFLNKELLVFVESILPTKLYYFKDNRLTSNFWYVFGGLGVSRFFQTFGDVVNVFLECGFSHVNNRKFKENLRIYHSYKNEYYPDQVVDDKVVITLEHVSSLFAIWGLGLFLALVAFLLEVAIRVAFSRNTNMFKNFVLFLIISATSARVHLTKNKEADLKKCVAQSVENIFDRDQTLTFVSDVGGGFVFPDAIENPYVMTNFSLAKVPKFAEIVSNDLNQVMHYTPTMSLDFDSEFVPKRIKLLLITTIANNVTEVFKKFWINGYENVVMIAYGTNYEPTIFFSDPYATVNKCRQEVKDLVVGDCASKTKYRFKDDRLRKYPNCNLLADISFFTFRNFLNGASIACSILIITTKYLNMSLEFSSEISSPVSTFDIRQSDVQTYDALSWTTVPYFRDDVIWIVPSPNQIAPMFVLKMVFKPTLWVVVFITFVCTAIVWWLLEKIYMKSSLSSVFLNVYSITISGSINDIPFQRSLRTIFIIYVVYSIHIQTAFTSNLIQLLTVPQYEPHITTLEDLADSNLPIIAVYDVYKFIHLEQDDNKLYSTIYKKLTGASVEEVVKLLIGDFNNYNIFLNKELLVFVESILPTKLYYFKDNRLTSNFWYVFGGLGVSRFFQTFGDVVNVFLECGFSHVNNRKFKENLRIYHSYKNEYYPDLVVDDKVVITLEGVSLI